MLLDGLRKIRGLSGAEKPEQWLVDWFRGGGESTYAGESINEDTALACAAVKAAVSVLAETVASVSLDVFKLRKSGGKDLATDHPVHRLLHDEPNEETSSFNWRETKQGHLGTWGNGYSEIRRTRGGQVHSLWQRSPRPERTKPFRADEDQKIYYECRDELGKLEANLPARDVLHIPGFGFDGLVGYSPISLGKQAIGTAKGAERYAAETFANNGTPSGAVSMDGEMSEEAYKRTKRSFNEAHSSHGERHKVMILEGGAKFAETQMHPADVQMLESRKFSVEEIARMYRLSPHLLQDLTHGTFSNITELGRQFIIFTMMPWFKRWTAEINRKLLAPPYEARFNAKSFLEGDHKARGEFLTKLNGIGVYTINEIRELEGANSIGPDGDIRFVPVNMQPLKFAKERPEPPPAPGVPPGAPPAEKPAEKPVKKPVEKQSAAARAVLAEALSRMSRKEARAAERAAKKPAEWVDWVDSFYAKHAATTAWATAPALTLLESLGDPVENAVEEHISRHREQLLDAADCQPEDLPRRVAEVVKQWENG